MAAYLIYCIMESSDRNYKNEGGLLVSPVIQESQWHMYAAHLKTRNPQPAPLFWGLLLPLLLKSHGLFFSEQKQKS